MDGETMITNEEEKYLDVLQNIEFMIVSVYKKYPDLSDMEVNRSLEAIIKVYHAEFRGHTLKQPQLQDKKLMVFEGVKLACESRLGREKTHDNQGGEQKTVDEILFCLRKIKKSVENWNKRSGRQGYLKFVTQFIV